MGRAALLDGRPERGAEPARAPVAPPDAALELEHDKSGSRRYRLGPGDSFYSPGMFGTASSGSRVAAIARENLDREIKAIARALQEHGPLERDDSPPIPIPVNRHTKKYHGAGRQSSRPWVSNAVRTGPSPRGPRHRVGGADIGRRASALMC
jgi:hypothetical protein